MSTPAPDRPRPDAQAVSSTLSRILLEAPIGRGYAPYLVVNDTRVELADGLGAMALLLKKIDAEPDEEVVCAVDIRMIHPENAYACGRLLRHLITQFESLCARLLAGDQPLEETAYADHCHRLLNESQAKVLVDEAKVTVSVR